MRTARKILAVGLTVLAIASAAFAAPSAAGKWKGRVVLDTSGVKLPPNLTPQQKKMVQAQFDMVKKMVITMDLKSNGTYTAKVSGVQGIPPDQQNETGKWSQKGQTVTLSPAKKGTAPAQKPQSLKLSGDGKKMTIALPASGGAKGTVIFSR